MPKQARPIVAPERPSRRTPRPSRLAVAPEPRPITPWRDFEHSLREMERSMGGLLGDIGDQFGLPLLSGLALQPGLAGELRFRPFGTLTQDLRLGIREPLLTWRVDEAKNEVQFRCEVPGLPKSDLNVEVTQDRIHIHGESGEHKYEAECIPGLQLDPDRAEASYQDGLLRLNVGLNEPATAKVRTIKIR